DQLLGASCCDRPHAAASSRPRYPDASAAASARSRMRCSIPDGSTHRGGVIPGGPSARGGALLEVRDPIHGAIRLTAAETEVVDHPFVQRLRNILQTG